MSSGGKRSFKDFLWNSEEKKFLGRTGLSWLKIGVFYVVFYACLLAFWVLCLAIFLQTINYREPKWTSENGGLIGTSPGLGYRPRPSDENIERTLIKFNQGKAENWVPWVKQLSGMVDSYSSTGDKLKDCQDGTLPATGDESCIFDINSLYDCNKEKGFGYEMGQPCVVLKLNKVIGWKPQSYMPEDPLPETMPQDLQSAINSSTTDDKVWVSCEGYKAGDKENLNQIKYYPNQYFPGYFFPFKGQPSYHSPLVAVQFFNMTSGIAVTVDCKVWAKNIDQDTNKGIGSVRFELMMDTIST